MTPPLAEEVPCEPDGKAEGDVKKRGEEKRAKHADSLASMLRRFLFRLFLRSEGRFAGGCRCRFGPFRGHSVLEFQLSFAGKLLNTRTAILGCAQQPNLHSPEYIACRAEFWGA